MVIKEFPFLTKEGYCIVFDTKEKYEKYKKYCSYSSDDELVGLKNYNLRLKDRKFREKYLLEAGKFDIRYCILLFSIIETWKGLEEEKGIFNGKNVDISNFMFKEDLISYIQLNYHCFWLEKHGFIKGTNIIDTSFISYPVEKSYRIGLITDKGYDFCRFVGSLKDKPSNFRYFLYKVKHGKSLAVNIFCIIGSLIAFFEFLKKFFIN